MLPVIFGLSGPALTADERAFFKSAHPAGYILFRRNVEAPDQLRALTDSLRALAGDAAVPILIDQEGGRVARLQPPHWPEFPPQAVFGALYHRAPLTALAAAEANATALALMLRASGINVDCLPVLDLVRPETHAIIGDRAFGADPVAVASLGRAVLAGLRRGGVAGVVKHIPGHGRAAADSHLELPRVAATAAELEQDLVPFRRLHDAPIAMTAHVLYEAWDKERCASVSPAIIADIIRGDCAFDNLLLSDDLSMRALAGQPGCGRMGERAGAVVAAGCDLALHCCGDFGEMEEIAAALPEIGAAASARLQRAMAAAGAAETGESLADALRRRDELLRAADNKADGPPAD